MITGTIEICPKICPHSVGTSVGYACVRDPLLPRPVPCCRTVDACDVWHTFGKLPPASSREYLPSQLNAPGVAVESSPSRHSLFPNHYPLSSRDNKPDASRSSQPSSITPICLHHPPVTATLRPSHRRRDTSLYFPIEFRDTRPKRLDLSHFRFWAPHLQRHSKRKQPDDTTNKQASTPNLTHALSHKRARNLSHPSPIISSKGAPRTT